MSDNPKPLPPPEKPRDAFAELVAKADKATKEEARLAHAMSNVPN